MRRRLRRFQVSRACRSRLSGLSPSAARWVASAIGLHRGSLNGLVRSAPTFHPSSTDVCALDRRQRGLSCCQGSRQRCGVMGGDRRIPGGDLEAGIVVGYGLMSQRRQWPEVLVAEQSCRWVFPRIDLQAVATQIDAWMNPIRQAKGMGRIGFPSLTRSGTRERGLRAYTKCQVADHVVGSPDVRRGANDLGPCRRWLRSHHEHRRRPQVQGGHLPARPPWRSEFRDELRPRIQPRPGRSGQPAEPHRAVRRLQCRSAGCGGHSQCREPTAEPCRIRVIDPALPLRVTIEPPVACGLAFDDDYDAEFKGDNLVWTPFSPYRLMKAPIGGNYRNITSSIDAGSVRSRGCGGTFSEFVMVVDSGCRTTPAKRRAAYADLGAKIGQCRDRADRQRHPGQRSQRQPVGI